ncbi:hypothetical protein TCAL_04579 [Tigriopus californicus]|uniref:Mitochondria-eating protein n=1 Tax=Tigriopus californicus TaxID=6832 RepID=A0A553PB82_TIGCA|nr:hypothetical protein TCAL_04579 [Tigriopus californicus]
MHHHQQHRMGSYFDNDLGLQPKKGILNMPSSTRSPPTPPPTSSIPPKPSFVSATFNPKPVPVSTFPSPPQSVAHHAPSRGTHLTPNRVLGSRPLNHMSAYGSGHFNPDKREIQRLRYEHEDMRQIHALNKRLASLTIADMSPKLARQRILLLYEKGDHREAAAFIRRVSQGTFRQIVNELPIDRFLEAMPGSMPILEAIYAKLYLVSANGTMSILVAGRLDDRFSPECVVWQIVRFFACKDDTNPPTSAPVRMEMCGPWVSTCKRLLLVLTSAEPRIKRVVAERRKALTRAIEGLGQHGMVGTSDQSIQSLHDALRLEFERVQKSYTEALVKLENLASTGKSPSKVPPVAQSHQRQLSLKMDEIQERLIKNKSLLNVMEPTLENHSLEVLLGILQRRIELDKEVMFQFTQLRKDKRLLTSLGCGRNPSVAPVLMRFQKGCQQVLDLMREVHEDVRKCPSGNPMDEEDSNSDYSGYHSDTDSAVMMSGNSPFISKDARYSFLQRSVRSGSKHNLLTAISTENLRPISESTLQSTRPDVSSHTPTRVNEIHASSSGISSNSSCTASPPDSDCNEDIIISNGSQKSIVFVGSGGSASVMSSGIPESSLTSSVASSAGGVFTRSQRSRKYKKEFHLGGPNSLGMVKSVSIGDLSSRCGKCDLNNNGRFHGLKCNNRESPSRDRSSSLLEESMELKRLRTEMAAMSNELREAKILIKRLETDHTLDRFTDVQSVVSESIVYDVHNGDRRPAGLVRKFGDLYSMARLDTLDDLDSIPELVDANELKSKLLFSVVVLSFRSATQTLEKMREQLRRILQLPPTSPSASNPSPTSTNITFFHPVTTQLWATLYDYPCLKSCQGLAKYVENCVRISWGLVNQMPQYVIEYDSRSFQSDLHVRFHTALPHSDLIKTYLWPALREGKNGPVVHKAVVIT